MRIQKTMSGTDTSPSNDLKRYMLDASRSLHSEYERIRARSREDPGTAGDNGEENWAALLRQWLPQHYHVVTKGRIMHASGRCGPQVDVLVLSPAYPPFLHEHDVRKILDRTTIKCNFSDLLGDLHSVPNTRGTERKMFSFQGGSKGDVYTAVLLALKHRHSQLGMRYQEPVNRIEDICIDEKPVGSAIVEACKQMGKIADHVVPGAGSIEWDEDYEVLNISDPYLLFFIRCLRKIDALAN